MPEDSGLPSRKADHIRINLEEDVHSSISTGLDEYSFTHEALPEFNLGDVDMAEVVFGRPLKAPLLISSMTGGTEQAAKINSILAEAAQQTGVAMGLGSQRAAIEHPELDSTFKVRRMAPDVLLFANLGAIQLNYAYTEDQCRRAVEMIEADALILHLNPLQEALQPEGDTLFAGLADKIERICKVLTVPVIAKEVGWGISGRTARLLASAGVAAIDVAGAGGTSWSQVEMFRIKDEHLANVASAFRGWGIPTAESIIQVKQAVPEMPVFASGGLRNGVDIAKCIALGASLGGMASPFLKAAVRGPEATVQTILEFKREIQICMFATASKKLADLSRSRLHRNNE
ncbi:MAG TPA: type 2 isopentenyl-diphosphate Delta-isomerase [Anaerolineaceae bacterium]|nr:type 2 isopentenyl-diphosphate Delta-isomerase [Anaerolineaceae bacterium]